MPSLSIALPVFVLGPGVYIVFALTMVFFRATYGFLGSGTLRRANVHLQFVLHHRRQS